jgi:two-component system CheB/CheR fusion protein
MAFVVIDHLAEKARSFLPDILSCSTALPVAAAVEETMVEPNHVYVMPETAD